MKSAILFENESFWVIDKAAGTSVHNPLPNEHCLLDELPSGAHLAHRLDKETSGLILVAKNNRVAPELMELFEGKKSQKVYAAALRGSIPPSEIWQQWKWPITDKGEGRKNPQGMSKDRKEALTLWRIPHSTPHLSLALAQIVTGRQHQIRKHSALAKHPIVGDPRYNDEKYNQKIEQLYNTRRMFLHAYQLQFTWRETHFNFTAPLPEDFFRLFPDLKGIQISV